EITANIATQKFLPIIRRNPAKATPVFLGTRLYIDFDDDGKYSERLEDLLREIHGAPRIVKPPIGPNPFANRISPEVARSAPREVLEDLWFADRRKQALPKAQSYGKATMEAAFGMIDDPLNVDQRRLLEAVERSAIHTFGWPIGVVLHTDDGKPKPMADGIVADIVSKGLSGHDQAEFWALRQNGDFYTIHNLFEDERAPNAIFFNTRIVRV